MFRVLLALLMVASVSHAEETFSISLQTTNAPFLPVVEPGFAPPMGYLSYRHTDFIVKTAGIPVNYAAFVSPSGDLRMIRVRHIESPVAPFPSAAGNALVVKPPAWFR